MHPEELDDDPAKGWRDGDVQINITRGPINPGLHSLNESQME